MKMKINNIFLCCLLFYIVFICSINLSSGDKIAYGDYAYVTLYLSPLLWSNGEYKRLVSRLKVDDISSINLKGSWNSASYTSDTLINSFTSTSWYDPNWATTTATTETIGLGVAIECNGVISYQQGYRVIKENYDSTGTSITDKTPITFPVLMAIITVTKGVVTGISWDQECKWCTSKCTTNTYNYDGKVSSILGSSCYVLDTECTDSDGSFKKLCQLNVYIAWAGTDKNGEDLKTASSRFSRLASGQVTEFVKSLKSETNSDSTYSFY